MSKHNFREALRKPGCLLLDGGTGTMLQAAGMPAGVPPELYCLEHPEVIDRVHKSYAQAGADIITSCTFGASRFKLPEGADVFSVNKALAERARAAVSGLTSRPVFVAGDVGPSGLFLRPLGSLEPDDLIDAFAVQIRGLAAGGADLILVETQFDLAEARAAVVAARRECDLPIIVSMTFEAGLSLTGTTPDIFAQTMLNMGVEVVGTNCSLGPVEMRPVVEALLASGAPHVMAEPNAGLPELRQGQTVFPLAPEPYAEATVLFAEMGVKVLGGCCGTTPDHIRLLANSLHEATLPTRVATPVPGVALTTRTRMVRLGADFPFAVIGERINPTGKPVLSATLLKSDFSEALRLADEQLSCGAEVLDVNVGAPMADETLLLPDLVSLLTARLDVPLCLDSSNQDALVAAIPHSPASCLLNSISGEGDKLEILGPVCRTFGIPFILLPISGTKLPVRASERIAILEKLLGRIDSMGIPRRLVLVDVLALSASANAQAPGEALNVIAWCASQQLPTTIGLSNTSFGLPARELVNSTFLCMAAGAGLSSCIANPASVRLREAVAAIRLLLGHDSDARDFIAAYSGWKNGAQGAAQMKAAESVLTLRDAVLHGDKENVGKLLEEELARGAEPFALVNDVLIPAITEVGSRYEKKEYFLPQLIRSAETMQLAFARLRPLLEAEGSDASKPVVVMATVEGDIHDIGKNIVSLLLGNHGFEVVDAGKDVPASEIVECARKSGASIIGLSALMTTTMVRMRDTIDLVRKLGLPIRIMVGGAAVTQDFAESIGADAYCEDAVSGVKAAQKLLGEMQTVA